MPKGIVIRNSGPNTQARFNLNGAGDHVQIEVVEMGESSGEVIFTGEKFSQPDFVEGGGKESEDRFFSAFPKK